MKILVISTWDPSQPDNGSRIRAHYLVRALASRHVVTVVAFGDDSHSADARALDVAEYHRVLDDPFRYTVLPAGLKWLSPVPLALWKHRSMVQSLRPMTQRSWDAIVAIQPMAATYLGMFDAPSIIDVDTSLSFQMRERVRASHHLAQRVRAWVSYHKARMAERRLFRHAKACSVVSGVEIPYLADMLGTDVPNLIVSDNGVDCQVNRPIARERRPASLIYNGSLTYDANFDAMFYFLSEIYPRIQGYVPNVDLTITGSTRGVKLDRLSLQESVRLSGFVDDVRSLVAQSAVCVIPLRRGSGTRLKILEAMALGTPVVSTTKGAEGLDLTDGQHLLIADDRQAFAESVVRVLREPGLSQRLIRNARKHMEERYDWQIIGARFVDLVERVAGTGAMPPPDSVMTDAS